MLDIEIVKFEVEDVITTSTLVVPSCSSGAGHSMQVAVVNGKITVACSSCGYTGSGDVIVGG